MRYFSIVGNTPYLSMAELVSVLKQRGIEWKAAPISEEAFLFETEVILHWSELLSRLGGIIKAGVVIATDVTEDAVPARIEEWVRTFGVGRFRFGVSVYRASNTVSVQAAERVARNVQAALLMIKKSLRSEDIRFRMVTSRERALSSVVLETNKVLEKGGELIVFVRSDKMYDLGKTEAVQDFKTYRLRDIGRPRRNAKRGMLPPKLAQIMVNLAEVPEGGVILDPFCGSGTVLQEAMLLGYKVIGADILREAVEDTRENLEWLEQKFQETITKEQTISKSQIHALSEVEGSNPQLCISDVRMLPNHISPHFVDAIVTEPWLGPPQRGRETAQELEHIRVEAHNLITDAFASFKKVLKPGGSVVMVLPVIDDELISINTVEQNGWSIQPLLPAVIATPPERGKQSLSSRNTIIYKRPDQFIAREIVRMRKSQ